MYIDLVMGLNFAVDLLLLLGTNALSGYSSSLARSAAGAAIGGIYGGICLLPGFSFLGNLFWRAVVLCLMAVSAFGLDKSALPRGILFILLSMALGGIALGIGDGGIPALLAAAAAVALMCWVGFRGSKMAKRFFPVYLRLGSNSCDLTAMHDTGNTLKDPVTGKQVLVVGANIAWKLLRLTQRDLQEPMQTITRIPGLRLIPYRAVGQSCGLLLATKVDEMRIGGSKRDMIIAFAPDDLGENGYEALVGGL